MNFLRPAAVLIGTLALASPAFAQTNTLDNMHNAVSKHALTIQLGQQNKSGETGSATLTDVPGGVKVVVALKGEPSGVPEPAHIHKGSCANLNPLPYKALTSITGGSSTTTVSGMTVAGIKAGRYAINVHKSASQLPHYVACGDL